MYYLLRVRIQPGATAARICLSLPRPIAAVVAQQRFLLHKCLRGVTLCTALLLSTLGKAEAVELAGVRIPDQITLANTTLVLNGAGVRYKAIFKVYAAGLYLSKKASTSEEVYATPGPKRIALTMLRDVNTNELGKLFVKGIEDNMEPGAFVKLIPDIAQMGRLFARHKEFKTGETLLIEWVPDTGVVITAKGKAEDDVFKNPAFYNALLRIWLGPNPPDWTLKDALLGRNRS